MASRWMGTVQNQNQEKVKPVIVGPDRINGKNDWSRYNATIVGYHPLLTDHQWGKFDDSKPAYKVVFFGADREYGPEEGWQRVGSKRKTRSRQWHGQR